MGFIALKGVEVFGKIGVLPEERLIGRKFIVDIEVKCSLKKASETDSIHDVMNYELLANAIHNQLKAEFRLMEAACRAIAQEILTSGSEIESLKIRILKHSPLMKGNIEASMVEWHYPEDY
jgi:dihydroneopterin aldolase